MRRRLLRRAQFIWSTKYLGRCSPSPKLSSGLGELSTALETACAEQMQGVTTFIEVVLNQELGEPFRRDAMKKPVIVAGIDPADMRPQQAS